MKKIFLCLICIICMVGCNKKNDEKNISNTSESYIEYNNYDDNNLIFLQSNNSYVYISDFIKLDKENEILLKKIALEITKNKLLSENSINLNSDCKFSVYFLIYDSYYEILVSFKNKNLMGYSRIFFNDMLIDNTYYDIYYITNENSFDPDSIKDGEKISMKFTDGDSTSFSYFIKHGSYLEYIEE